VTLLSTVYSRIVSRNDCVLRWVPRPGYTIALATTLRVATVFPKDGQTYVSLATNAVYRLDRPTVAQPLADVVVFAKIGAYKHRRRIVRRRLYGRCATAIVTMDKHPAAVALGRIR
jgi:hypothetical protein